MSDSLGPCVICGGPSVVVYPLLPGEPRFCHEHYTPKHAEPYGVDFSGPDWADDFDYPPDGMEYQP